MLGTLIFWPGVALVCWPLLYDLAALIRRKPHDRLDRSAELLLIGSGDVLLTIANVLWADWPWAIAFGALALWYLSRWWRRRKKRASLAALGNKARARIEAMKQAMRERAKPRPVLRPVPGGAR